jgi:hypothetical protein
MVVPSSRLADAERVLLASGWSPATSSLPGPRCPFEMIGFESLQAASKCFVHPQEDDRIELLLLPTSYVGLEGSTPGTPQLQLLSGYVNAYIPSLDLLATSFTYTALHSADNGTYWRLLLHVWCSYCRHSGGLGDHWLGGVDAEIQEYWDKVICKKERPPQRPLVL